MSTAICQHWRTLFANLSPPPPSRLVSEYQQIREQKLRMRYRMPVIDGHPVIAATRALRFADHVTKRNGGSGKEKYCQTVMRMSSLETEQNHVVIFLIPDCADELSTCEHYQSYCGHEDFVSYMTIHCPVTCGFCEGNKTIFIF